MVLRGYKHHSLVLGSNDITQQVEEHSSFDVLTHQEEGSLQGKDGCGLLAMGRWTPSGH